MAIRPSHIKDKTGLETNTHEARHARLRSLADSINDTARMARNSLSLLLIVALYLGLTLVASTDENLLRNGQVVLPQVGVGLSVVQSYIFAPLIFLYLHAQLLFQLTMLAWRVRTFEVALKEEFPDTALPNRQERVEAKREECRDWLSAFAFVQLFRLPPSMPHVSKVLVWFGIEAVPLTLLFILDLSFVRYQSDLITWEHHIIFIIDLVFLIWFNYRVFNGRFWVHWKRLIESFVKSFSWRSLSTSVATILAYIGSLVRGTLAVGMVLLLVFAAHPPSFDPKTVGIDRTRIQRAIRIGADQDSVWRIIEEFGQAVWKSGENPLDADPCEWWGLACRYLDVSNKRLSKTQTQYMSGPKSDSPSDKGFANIDLTERRLCFANFQYAQLRSADLRGARLQGANLREARLQGTNLKWAQLQEANLQYARLQGASFTGARLQGANLHFARLQEADFLSAEMQGVHLYEAQLQGANLRGAQLQGANLRGAEMQGAFLWSAQLQGADLRKAQLQCADLRRVWLQGADLGGAQLQGVYLKDEKLADSSSKLHPWYLAWTPGVSYDFPADKSSYLKTLATDETANVKRGRRRDLPLKEHLQECIEEDWKPIDPLPDNYSQPVWNVWAEWTAEFACGNTYTARSSLGRWTAFKGALFGEEPLSGLEGSAKTKAEKLVRKALITARKKEEKCPGLHSIPDDEWKRFVEGIY